MSVCVCLYSGEGGFQCTLEVPEDGCYQYKFLVDGQWQYDSTKVSALCLSTAPPVTLPSLPCTLQPTIEDTFGGLNNVMDTTTQTAA